MYTIEILDQMDLRTSLSLRRRSPRQLEPRRRKPEPTLKTKNRVHMQWQKMECDNSAHRERVAVGINECDEAWLEYHLAPLLLKRGMEILGLVHRSLRELGPNQFQTFFVQLDLLLQMEMKRNSACRHPTQLRLDRSSQYFHFLPSPGLG